MEQFNLSDYAPNQGTPKHPLGKFAARISDTGMKPFKGPNAEGANLEIEFTTDQGRITKRYGIFSNNAEQQRIAREALSALAYVTGVRNPTVGQSCFEFRNMQCVIEVAPQAGNDKFNDVVCVYDMRGELPKASAPAHNPQPGFNPTAPQPGFGNPNPPPPQPAPTGQFLPPVNPAMAPAPMAPVATGFGAPAQQFQPQPMQPPGGAPNPGWGQPAPQQPSWATPQG